MTEGEPCSIILCAQTMSLLAHHHHTYTHTPNAGKDKKKGKNPFNDK